MEQGLSVRGTNDATVGLSVAAQQAVSDLAKLSLDSSFHCPSSPWVWRGENTFQFGGTLFPTGSDATINFDFFSSVYLLLTCA